jgi:large subunit ribosomal protein L10
MENPRPEKVAVVNEVRERLDGAQGAILTEYRGLTVREMAALRQALVAAGGDYKVYKNTLVKLAIAGGRHEPLDALLEGPTAIAFVSGEVSAVAKALRDYARTNPSLVIKGGLHGEGFLSAQDLGVLADLPPRDVLLARMAGAIAAPMQQLAGLLQALPRSLAYGLSALLEQKGGAPAEAEAEAPAEAAAPAEAPPEAEAAPVEATAEAETPSADASGGDDVPTTTDPAQAGGEGDGA